LVVWVDRRAKRKIGGREREKRERDRGGREMKRRRERGREGEKDEEVAHRKGPGTRPVSVGNFFWFLVFGMLVKGLPRAACFRATSFGILFLECL